MRLHQTATETLFTSGRAVGRGATRPRRRPRPARTEELLRRGHGLLGRRLSHALLQLGDLRPDELDLLAQVGLPGAGRAQDSDGAIAWQACAATMRLDLSGPDSFEPLGIFRQNICSGAR